MPKAEHAYKPLPEFAERAAAVALGVAYACLIVYVSGSVVFTGVPGQTGSLPIGGFHKVCRPVLPEWHGFMGFNSHTLVDDRARIELDL